jgi:hypothetical protein
MNQKGKKDTLAYLAWFSNVYESLLEYIWFNKDKYKSNLSFP